MILLQALVGPGKAEAGKKVQVTRFFSGTWCRDMTIVWQMDALFLKTQLIVSSGKTQKLKFDQKCVLILSSQLHSYNCGEIIQLY